MDRYIRLSETLRDALRLPVHLLAHGTFHVSDRAFSDDSPFLHDPKLIGALQKDITGAVLLPDRDFRSVYYGIASLDEDVYLVIGPCATVPIEDETRHEYMTMHGMTDYQNYTIPTAPLQRIKAALELALGCPDDSGTVADHVSAQKNNIVMEGTVPAERLMKESLKNTEADRQHHSYRYEQQIMQLLKECREEALADLLDGSDYSELGIMSHSAQKQSEYLAVLFVSLMVRAAIEAYVDPYRAYSLNDLYLQRISEAKRPEQHRKIMQAAIHQLIAEIRNAKTQRGVLPHAERAKQYIRSNLNRELTLAEISGAVGVSPNYLSAIFSEQEGITMKAFILNERLEAAKIILRDTNIPISEIAAYLHFSNHSHLSTAFKQLTGETPTQYRNRNQIIQEHKS